jgi:hypothetical protein
MIALRLNFNIRSQLHDATRSYVGWHDAEPSSYPPRIKHRGQPMRNLPHLSPTAWALIALPTLVAARCLMTTIVPQLVHAAVPEVVRQVLRVI